MNENRTRFQDRASLDPGTGEVTRREFLRGCGAAVSAAPLLAATSGVATAADTRTTGNKSSSKAGRRTLLVKNIHTLVTMDEKRREIRNGALFVRGNVIEAVGETNKLPRRADEILDLKDHYIVMPGMVNAHHHFYQVLTRVVKPDGTLFPWLKKLYPIWANMRKVFCLFHKKIERSESIIRHSSFVNRHSMYSYERCLK